jgi:hypothetical protein
VTFKNPKAVSGQRISAPAQLPQNTDKEPPSFCLRFIVPKYCLTKCNTEQQAAFAQRLYELSRSTWVELRNAGKKGGTEVLPQFRIKEPIPASITPDVTLVAFRFWKKAPMVGFRDGRTFYIVWLDIDFSLYDHE